jgi:hypothetical protein
MRAWFVRLLNSIRPPRLNSPGPLRATPARRRIKHYAALSGYAYEYYFEGYRVRGVGREYLFKVSGDRKSWFAFQINLDERAIAAWELAHERTLAENERYAAAKLALFAAFDERPNPSQMQSSTDVTVEIVEELLSRLEL